MDVLAELTKAVARLDESGAGFKRVINGVPSNKISELIPDDIAELWIKAVNDLADVQFDINKMLKQQL